MKVTFTVSSSSSLDLPLFSNVHWEHFHINDDRKARLDFKRIEKDDLTTPHKGAIERCGFHTLLEEQWTGFQEMSLISFESVSLMKKPRVLRLHLPVDWSWIRHHYFAKGREGKLRWIERGDDYAKERWCVLTLYLSNHSPWEPSTFCSSFWRMTRMTWKDTDLHRPASASWCTFQSIGESRYWHLSQKTWISP